MSIGLIAAAFVCLFAFGIRAVSFSATKKHHWLGTFLFLIFLRSTLDVVINFSPEKVAALFGLLIIIFVAVSFASYLNRADTCSIYRAIIVCASILILLLFFSIIFNVNMQNYQEFPKNIFPYSEPSHFAINTVPLLALAFFICGPLGKTVILSTVILSAILYPSLVLAVQGSLILAIYLAARVRRNLALLFVLPTLFVPLALIFADSLFLLDFTYFTDRLNFGNTKNISSLVYLQGWNRAFLSIQETGGLGVGFQNLQNVSFGQFSNQLEDILGQNKNFNDGGFVAAKLIGEFGILGVAAVLFYGALFFRTVLEAINFLRTNESEEQGDILRFIANILIVFFSVELLIRGTGYFSLGIILFWTGYSLRHLRLGSVKSGRVIDVRSTLVIGCENAEATKFVRQV
jgi:hypothetical protein